MTLAASFPDVDAAAPAGELLRLAEAYRMAARSLIVAEAADAAATAPARFCALHALELYLDAFLRALGESPCRLKAHAHNLGMRAALAIARGLPLRRKTALHLVALTSGRGHLATRYGPVRPAAKCELNRLAATLEEVAAKVAAALSGQAAGAPRGAAA